MAGFLIARQSVPSGTPAKGCHCYHKTRRTSSPVAKPPAGSSLLFGALADSGRIKQRKNGSYRMVLKGVDEIDWFTDRPNRVAGEWSPKKLVKKWESLFGGVEPNAQATFEMGSKRKLVTFEMFKPRLNDSEQKLSFKIRGIRKKNRDLLTGLKDKQLSDTSLFIDDGSSLCGAPDLESLSPDPFRRDDSSDENSFSCPPGSCPICKPLADNPEGFQGVTEYGSWCFVTCEMASALGC